MKAGRHRTFDTDIALDKAMEVFWTNGYLGTTLTDLTNAMKINKPSLYSAFGNKEELYKSVLDRYVQKHGIIHTKCLFKADESLDKRVGRYLTSIAKMVTAEDLPGGCLVCISTSEIAGNCLPHNALQAVTSINNLTTSSLIDFFGNEKQKGNLSDKQLPKAMANYVMSLQFGLAVMSRNGARFEELSNVIEISTSVFK